MKATRKNGFWKKYTCFVKKGVSHKTISWKNAHGFAENRRGFSRNALLTKKRDTCARNEVFNSFFVSNGFWWVTPLKGHSIKIKRNYQDPLNNIKGWIASDSSPCDWEGVDCTASDSPRVWSLNLSCKKLSGYIPSGIGKLTVLKVLNFSGNNLIGGIPPELGNCKQLGIFGLRRNMLLVKQ